MGEPAGLDLPRSGGAGLVYWECQVDHPGAESALLTAAVFRKDWALPYREAHCSGQLTRGTRTVQRSALQ